MNHACKSRTALALCLGGLSVVAMTANARTVERVADGTIRFLTRFNGPADVYLDKITLEPSDFVHPHYHPGDAVNIVSQGTLTLRNRCRPDQHFSAGQAFVEVADVVHQLVNEGTEPVVFYGTIVGPGLGPVGFVDTAELRDKRFASAESVGVRRSNQAYQAHAPPHPPQYRHCRAAHRECGRQRPRRRSLQIRG